MECKHAIWIEKKQLVARLRHRIRALGCVETYSSVLPSWTLVLFSSSFLLERKCHPTQQIVGDDH